MTDQELNELEQLCNEASPGPWEVRPVGTIIGHSEQGAVATPGAFDWICSMQTPNCPKWREDATFIVATRDAMPKLIALVREQRRLAHYIVTTKDAEIEQLQRRIENLEAILVSKDNKISVMSLELKKSQVALSADEDWARKMEEQLVAKETEIEILESIVALGNNCQDADKWLEECRAYRARIKELEANESL